MSFCTSSLLPACSLTGEMGRWEASGSGLVGVTWSLFSVSARSRFCFSKRSMRSWRTSLLGRCGRAEPPQARTMPNAATNASRPSSDRVMTKSLPRASWRCCQRPPTTGATDIPTEAVGSTDFFRRRKAARYFALAKNTRSFSAQMRWTMVGKPRDDLQAPHSRFLCVIGQDGKRGGKAGQCNRILERAIDMREKKNASGAGGCAHRRSLALWPPGLLLTRHDNLRGRHRFADRRIDAHGTTRAVAARLRHTLRGFLFAGDALLDEVAHVAGMVALPFGAVSFAALLVQKTAPVARRQALRLTARRA